MTTTTAQNKVSNTGWPDGLMRLLSITWPRELDIDGSILPLTFGRAHMRQTDTNKPVHARIISLTPEYDPGHCIVATLEMCVDAEGNPLIGGNIEPVADNDGYPCMAEFKWVVAEMNISDNQ